MSNPRYIQRYSAVSAWLTGVVLLLGGFIIIGLSLIDLFSRGGAGTFLRELVDSPYGLAIVFGFSGLMVTAFGIIRILSGSATSPGTHGPHVEFSIKAWGVIYTLIGLVMLVFAVGKILAPELLKSLFEQGARIAKSLIINQ